MKIDLNLIDREQFYVNEHILSGELVYLVVPKQMGCVWSQQNKIFRSSVWNSNGELISASFPKFVNFGEKPEVFPVPTSLKGVSIIEKLDGSTLIVSKYKGQFIIRTRGTVDASTMEKNGDEIEIFKAEILPIFIDIMGINGELETWPLSYIFEWTSPLNRIVIDYGDKPKFSLIGIINHEDYSLVPQFVLDDTAKQEGLNRPDIYTFETIDDLLFAVELWENREGVCIYSKNGQMIHKVKSFSYLKLHLFKSNATFENTVELFFEFGMPTYQEFEAKLIEKFDYECFCMVRSFISQISDGYKEVNKIIAGMKGFVEKNNHLSRKDFAAKVFSSYGGEGNNRASFVFNIFDGKTLDKNQQMKLLYQVTKD